MKLHRLFLFVLPVLFCAVSVPSARGQNALELTIEKTSTLALERNLDVQIARYDAYMKRNDLYNAVSIFDSILNAAVTYTDDQLQRSSTILGTKSKTTEYEVGVSKKLPTGTTVGVGYDHTRSWSNSAFASLNPAHDSRVSLSIKQEVGKNFFGLLDRSQVKITKLDIENAQYTSLEKIESELADAQKAHWSVVLQREKVALREAMVERAKELQRIYTDKVKIGMAEKPDLYAAEANLRIRKKELLRGENVLRRAINAVLLKLNYDIREDIVVVIREKFSVESADYEDFVAHLAEAIANRRDYQRALNDVESDEITLVMKKNSLWPEIDLEASFLRNGVATKYTKAVEKVSAADNPEYFFGITFSVPLENSKAKGEFKNAQLGKAQSLILLKKIEREIVVEVHDAVDATNTVLEEVKQNMAIVELQGQKLREEEKRFRLGRSNSDTLIRFQEDLLRAQLELMDSLYAYYAHRIDLDLTQHSLLDKNWEYVL